MLRPIQPSASSKIDSTAPDLIRDLGKAFPAESATSHLATAPTAPRSIWGIYQVLQSAIKSYKDNTEKSGTNHFGLIAFDQKPEVYFHTLKILLSPRGRACVSQY